MLFYFSNLVTAATDKTMALWDVDVGSRVKKFKGHTGFVNCCNVARRGPQLVCSGSDDQTIKVLWNLSGQQNEITHYFI